jgi:L,D-peptidoglycan transpeptidase YkuD (ErfK/YbiS/YcfS/YnhG family)
MRFLVPFILILILMNVVTAQVKTPQPPPVKIPFTESLQVVVVTTADPSAIQGTARLYERKSVKSKWKNAGDEFPVVVGQNGLAWAEEHALLTRQNDAPTLNPIYVGLCGALERKDEKTLRSYFTSDTIKGFEDEMRRDGIRSVVEFLSHEQMSRKSCQARNEEISGDLATVDLISTTYPNGYRALFVKQGGTWKLSNVDPKAIAPVKKEGDGKSPAGMFPLTFAFGRPDKPSDVKLSYTKIESYTECVDDVSSTHYNKIVDRLQVGNFDWKSSEKMLEVGPAYDLGINVAHNSYPVVKGNGSCIFLHVWSDATTGTSGCTAMKREDLQKILAWANPDQRPYLVQMTESDYKNLRKKWKLPKLK